MFKVLMDGCTPTRATKYSACIDLYSSEDVVIGAGETAKVRLGVCIDIENLLEKIPSVLDMKKWYKRCFDADATKVTIDDSVKHLKEEFLKSHYLQLEPRSSLRAKGLIAGAGIIDLDYKDEIMIILHNPVQLHRFVQNCENRTVLAFDDDVEFKISKGEKIAQIMLCEHKSWLLGYESETERTGGFGHSGK